MFLAEKRKIDVNGRIQLPSAMREEMGLKDGDDVYLTCVDSKITISNLEVKTNDIRD